MSKKILASSKQLHLITAIGHKTINSVHDLADTHLLDKELKVIRSTVWSDLSITENQLQMMQRIKSYVTKALAERKRVSAKKSNFSNHNAGRRKNHNIDHSANTAHDDDFSSAKWLKFRGNEGQVRQQNAEVVKLNQPEKLQSAVA
jgi:hypothetical protein